MTQKETLINLHKETYFNPHYIENPENLHIDIPTSNRATIVSLSCYNGHNDLTLHPLTVTNYLAIGRCLKEMSLAQLKLKPDELPDRSKSRLHTSFCSWDSLRILFWTARENNPILSLTHFGNFDEVTILGLSVHDIALLRWTIANTVRDLLRRQGETARQEVLLSIPKGSPKQMYCQTCNRSQLFSPPVHEITPCECGGEIFSYEQLIVCPNPNPCPKRTDRGFCDPYYQTLPGGKPDKCSWLVNKEEVI